MAIRNFGERIGKTQYICISEWKNTSGTYFKSHMRINGRAYTCSNNDAKQCALQLDKKLIESGCSPINILKPK